MHTNRLANEKSPYLLQHAHNPVDWYPWGSEAFDKARSEDKPIFLSIGYSTCHWCHVMERESFESDTVAEVLNQFFVPIKVDREERPDIDRIYMTFVQATTGSGGWPMSVWLTPDLKPFYGGTYYPPNNGYGRPGFRHLLEHLAGAWKGDRAKILESGDKVVEQLRGYVDAAKHAPVTLDKAVFDSCFLQLRRSYDRKLGGFGGAPKFPRAVNFNFLFRYFKFTGEDEAAEMSVQTLRHMANGGMNDQIGGGFHRYSVDAKWFVSHFEKMLYDQGQLAVSYLDAFQITGDEFFADVARSIFEYVLRDLLSPEGAFFSAEDADSVIDPAEPKVKGEGAFYIWTREQIASVLGEPAASDFCARFGVLPGGNVYEDPHGEFTGKNILYRAQETTSSLRESIAKLLTVRSERVRPHLDDKILTAWNGLMISAFARGGFVLAESRYIAAAERAASFVLGTLGREGALLRRYRDGEAAIPGFLDDYSYFVQGLLDLYEASFVTEYLDAAVKLTEKMRDLFEDPEGGFFDSGSGDEHLVLRLKEDYDGAEPSGNSVAISNLLRLAQITGNTSFRESAERGLRSFAGKMAAQPTAMPQMLVAAMRSMTPPKQVVLAGDAEALQPLRETLRKHYLPDYSILPSKSLEMGTIDGRAAAYVCENFACQLPVNDPAELERLLQ